MLPDLNSLVQPIADKIKQFKTLDCSLPPSFTNNVSTINNCSVEYGTSSSCITNKKGQRIFLSNNWFYIAAILAPLHEPFNLYKDLLNKVVDKDVLKQADVDRIKLAINVSPLLDSKQDKEYLIKFATDPLWWNGGNSNTGGKTLDRNDALVSAVLSIANLVNASQSYIATLWDYFGENPSYIALLNSIADKLIESNTSVDYKNSCKDRQIIFFGVPGSGKSYKVARIVDGRDDLTFRTTFYPDSDYTTFVGTYKPVKEDDNLTYEFVPQAFIDAYVKAWTNPDKTVYLVIEEINRGNCAQIFGDLFQLLDRGNDGVSEYPIKADTDLRKYLESNKGLGSADHDGIKGGKLCLPNNLHILATMNTSDQSLFPMDSAFKRRWAWEYVPINAECPDSQFNITIGVKIYKWASFLTLVNDRIHKLSDSEDKQMGNFFIKDNIDVEDFKSKVMFYLWSEICKEYEHAGSFFKYKGADGKEVEFTFNSLFPTNESTNAILQGFMAYLGVEEAPYSATE